MANMSGETRAYARDERVRHPRGRRLRRHDRGCETQVRDTRASPPPGLAPDARDYDNPPIHRSAGPLYYILS